MRLKNNFLNSAKFFALGLLVASVAMASSADLATLNMGASAVRVDATSEFESLTLRVNGPAGFAFEETIARGDSVYVELGGMPDGAYTYEIRPVVKLAPGVADAARAAREAGDTGMIMALRASGDLPRIEAQTGTFTVANGATVTPGELEEIGAVTRSGETGGNVLNTLDQVFLDDLIVDGSACIGQDCVNGENFGFDTLRLKENNLRIKFDDTSSSGSFPNNDWQLTANDSANGGANRFSIDDITNSKTPFTVQGNTPNNALVLEASTGDIGMGTATPVVELHVVDGDSPTLRLEQDGSSGFQSQTWDLAGNETNFFVRDVTNSSKLPFKIRPGADDNSLVIDNDNNIGLGILNATSPLHVFRSSGDFSATPMLLVDANHGDEAARDLFRLENNGVTRFRMVDASADGTSWQFRVGQDSFNITQDGTGGNEFEILPDGTVNMGPGNTTVFELTPAGQLTVVSLVQSSDRNAKEDIVPVNGASILERVANLPLATWSYKADTTGAQHLGPMAQDFAAAFGLGVNDITISPLDVAGVALASVQELNARLADKQTELEELEAKNAELEAKNASFEERLQALEAALQNR